MDIDVLVVGAGPTGLTLACALRLHGLSVRIVDRAGGPATTSRANFLHARGSEVLGRIGGLGTLPEESLRAMRITSYLGGRPLMTLEFGDPGLGTAAPPMVVSQARVEGALRDRLAALGLVPEWGRALVGLRQEPGCALAELDGGETVRARWVVGCDGTSSSTRQLADIGFPGVKLTERFLLADVHLDWDVDRGGTSGWIHPDGVIGVMPMPDPQGGGDLWRVFAYDPDQGQKPTDGEILQRIRTVLPERTGLDVRVGDPQWLSVFTVHRRLAHTYRRGRILIAGDAAHAHSPFGGQGMLTGIGDAENLAFKLALVVRGLAADAAGHLRGRTATLGQGGAAGYQRGDQGQHREQPGRALPAGSGGPADLQRRCRATLDDLHRVTAMGELSQGTARRARAQAAAGGPDRRHCLHACRRDTRTAAPRTRRPVGIVAASRHNARSGRHRGAAQARRFRRLSRSRRCGVDAHPPGRAPGVAG